MILWFAATACWIVWLVFRSPALDYRLVALGAVLPVAEAPFGSHVLHTLAASIACLAAVMGVTVGRRLRRRQLLGVPIGMMLHLVLDGTWTSPEQFWWPAAGGSLGTVPVPELDRGLLMVSFEVVGIAIAAWLFNRWGLDDAGRRHKFVTTGQLDRLVAGREDGGGGTGDERGC